MKSAKYTQNGAVLLEAIIALLLFTLVGFALINVTNQAMLQQTKIFNARCANWLADNIMAIEFITPPDERRPDKQGESHQCGVLWSWEIKQRSTNDNRFNMVTLHLKNNDTNAKFERKMLRYR